MYQAPSSSINIGVCTLCDRAVSTLTEHHAHPRFNGRRHGPPGLTEEQLERCIPLCFPCHSLSHYIMDNETMGMSFHSAELLRTHPRITAWINWVVQQPDPTPVALPLRAKPGRRQLYRAKLRRTKEAAACVRAIRVELEKMWLEAGGTFPRWTDGAVDSGGGRREALLGQLVCRGVTDADESALLVAVKSIRLYRDWYLWLFDDPRGSSLSVDVGYDPNMPGGVDERRGENGGVSDGPHGAADVVDNSSNTVENAPFSHIGVIDLTGAGNDHDLDNKWYDMDID